MLIIKFILVVNLSLHISSFLSNLKSILSTKMQILSFQGYQQPQSKEGAYNLAKKSEVVMPCIILVNPYLDQNVGSVARSMLNFGLTELRVVDPLCDILSDNSRSLAAGAYEVLENAKVYSNLKDCLSDLNRVMATTIRPRHMTQTVVSPSEAARVLINIDSFSITSGNYVH